LPIVHYQTEELDIAKLAKVKVALIDLDAKVGFLPDLVNVANNSQSYYSFQVTYMPLPSGVIRNDFDNGMAPPQIYLPRLEESFLNISQDLKVDKVCCLTACLIAGKENGSTYWNHFSAPLNSNHNVFVISSYDMRSYGRKANVPFSKVMLYICLSMLLATDERWNVVYHEQTAGCLLDYCKNRADIVAGLKKMTFSHESCRRLITDDMQLKAIDELLNVVVPENI